MKPMSPRVFSDCLMQQRRASPHTIAGYRDTFRLLVRYAWQTLKKTPADLELSDLEADFVGSFQNHLESERGNDARSRNTRLAAVRSIGEQQLKSEPALSRWVRKSLMPVRSAIWLSRWCQ